jgi:hypothetical protein
MSKVDAQRALRDARYAAYRASRAAAGVPVDDAPPPPLRVRPVEPAAAPKSSAGSPAPSEVVTEEVAEDAPALCGHRNIGNRTCQRPAGHPEKNHRYT